MRGFQRGYSTASMESVLRKRVVLKYYHFSNSKTFRNSPNSLNTSPLLDPSHLNALAVHPEFLYTQFVSINDVCLIIGFGDHSSKVHRASVMLFLTMQQ